MAVDVQNIIKEQENILGGSGRIIVRKSGTEPIVKVYCETVMEDSSQEGKIKALNLHDEIATRIKASTELVKKHRT